MSKNGGSEKTTRALVAAYNKSRLSTRASRAEAPAGIVLHSWRTNPLPPVPPLVLLLLSGQKAIWGEDAGRATPTGYHKTLAGTHAGMHRPLPPLVAPTEEALCDV